jgi:hypothetical protein
VVVAVKLYVVLRNYCGGCDGCGVDGVGGGGGVSGCRWWWWWWWWWWQDLLRALILIAAVISKQAIRLGALMGLKIDIQVISCIKVLQ